MKYSNKNTCSTKLDQEKNEDFLDLLSEKLNQASVEFKEKVQEEQRKRDEIKSIHENVINALDQDSIDFIENVEKKFTNHKKEKLNMELQLATEEGNLEKIEEILEMLIE